jgi:hypothetical protein
MNSKKKGDVTELKCITYLNELGYVTSVPFGENARYDFIVDVCGILLRVQAKTCSFQDGSIEFSCESSRSNSHQVFYRKYSPNEIEYFATFYNDKCYFVPAGECGRSKVLRLSPPANNQKSKINLAEDYEVEVQIKKLLKRYEQ